MATEAKTKPTTTSLDEFLAAAVAPERHDDCRTLAAMMQKASGEPAVMWGTSIVGFGLYRQQYAGGREADWPLIAFSPRKNDLTLYVTPGFEGFEDLLSRLGKHKASKACLYIKRLADIDIKVLKTIVDGSVKAMAPRRVKA
ncbi:DUF1801 domain-containing protein [Casimicrobium huifangae]|uniref:DUF1801 domain-containing protein n=1 Tax=Casimicrobium huifangae TaxID=2591109 RepID=UPI0012EB4592|nr:DUF1801 domain-containing protein [Casimicrobium huifangae]